MADWEEGGLMNKTVDWLVKKLHLPMRLVIFLFDLGYIPEAPDTGPLCAEDQESFDAYLEEERRKDVYRY